MASGDDWRLECAPIDGSAPHSIFPVKVSGPSSFHLLAIWAMRQPSYVGGILRGLDCYREFLQGAPSIVIGDFNSPGNDARSRSHHAALEDRLLTEFALMNAWRVYAERTGQPIDEPTYYLQRQNDRPFHIDYCFFPEAWASTLRSVEIGNYSDWATDSDHRPILVEFE